jgi:hypothetical protein
MKRLLLLFLFLPLLSYAQEKLEENWYSLLLEGITVGFFHQTTWLTSDGLIHSEIEQTMEIRRFGIPFSMTQTDVWIEEKDGSLLSVSSELDMNGQGQRIDGRVEEQELRVRIRHNNKADEFSLPFENQLCGLYSVDREIADMITGGISQGKGSLDYRLFSPETMKIEEFSLRALGPGELTDSLGRVHRGILVEERSSSLPGVVTTEVYDEQAEFLYSKTPVGLELEILRLPGDPPEEFAAVFDVASLTVPVDGIEDLPLGSTEAVTVLFRGQGVPVIHESVRSAEEDLASPGGARAGNDDHPGDCDIPLCIVSAKRDARGAVSELVLELRSRPAAVRGAEPRTTDQSAQGTEAIPPELQQYLEGGFHLDLGDPRLTELLHRCGADGGSRSTVCLERLVDRYIQNKSLAYGFAGLEEVLSKREGDCTEHALLLVALLRKAGIPSRLAYGLILTEAGLIGHAWAEYYNEGRWHWLDPSFPRGRPYGLKIRLGVMDPAEPIWASLSLTLLQVAGNVEAAIQEAQLR